MAEESYRDYLAARVLTENKPVSCRSDVPGLRLLTTPGYIQAFVSRTQCRR
jgi:hypothetical protein